MSDSEIHVSIKDDEATSDAYELTSQSQNLPIR